MITIKRLINSLTAVFIVLALIFVATACTYGTAGARATTELVSDESERMSEMSNGLTEVAKTDTTTRISTTKESETSVTSAGTTVKPMTDDKKLEFTTNEQGTITETAKTSEKSEENNTGSLTLEINEVGDGWFTACHAWPSPLKYKVMYELGGNYKSGDIVEVSYNIDEMDDSTDTINVKALSVKESDFELKPGLCYKPVIYLYPEEKTQISVEINYNGKLTYTIPEYKSGWNVTAYPNGQLVDHSGEKYPYLFWEGEGEADYDLSKGFCVKGSDTQKFLCEKLSYMGMSKNEIEDFNEFWVPYLEKNPYNRVCFQTTAYTENAELEITPMPDSVLRVFMVFTPLEAPIIIEQQTLDTFERTGFAVVEWGGAIAN